MKSERRVDELLLRGRGGVSLGLLRLFDALPLPSRALYSSEDAEEEEEKEEEGKERREEGLTKNWKRMDEERVEFLRVVVVARGSALLFLRCDWRKRGGDRLCDHSRNSLSSVLRFLFRDGERRK